MNETFDSRKIKVINLKDNNAVEFDFVSKDNLDVIQINSIGWQTEKVNAQVSVSDVNIFNLVVDATRVNENCCSSTKINEEKIENAASELNEETRVYTIFVQ